MFLTCTCKFLSSQLDHTGDHGVCRNLARIAATVCATCLQCSTDRFASRLDPGVIQLLLKAAGHVSVHISAIALSALVDAAKNGLVSAEVFLPLLQQRAIAPHLVAGDGKASLVAFDLCGVAFDEFESVRYTILTEALRWCWQSNRNNYLDSCTSAIEEFCGSRPTVEISFQLEAALFCIETVAEDVTASGDTNDQSNQLRRCATCLKTMPEVLMSNPLTSFRACRLIHKVRKRTESFSLCSFYRLLTFVLSARALVRP